GRRARGCVRPSVLKACYTDQCILCEEIYTSLCNLSTYGVPVLSLRMRVFLITGASSGIGAAVARAVAAPDTSIVLHAGRSRRAAERTAQTVGAAGAHSLVVEGDLGQPGTATRLIEE